MVARFRSWWQQIKPHPVRIVLIALLAVVILLIVLSILGYIFNWAWTGLVPESSEPKQHAKTLWDWLQLLIIPAVLAVAGYVINLTISRSEQAATEQRAQSEREAAEKRAETEREIALDNQSEAALQEYINKISELMLVNDLRNSTDDKEARTIARVRTLTVLPRLDSKRKSSLLQFLYESHLIDNGNAIIVLRGADLGKAYLFYANLEEACLARTSLEEADMAQSRLNNADLFSSVLANANLNYASMHGINLSAAFMLGATLREADLTKADLTGAILTEADLTGATLIEADLSGAFLVKADLTGANLTAANLKDAFGITREELEKQTNLLEGATMPDGSTHP